jgi:hypothetical protein
MVVAPWCGLQPFLYNTLKKERLAADDYGCLVAQAIDKLRAKGVKVWSIVGDNLPVEVSALGHWSMKSRMSEISQPVFTRHDRLM